MSASARPSARCHKLLLGLSQYFDGELNAARRRTIERHIVTCKCCGTMEARLRRTIAACQAEGGRRPPRDVMTRAAARIRKLVAQGRSDPSSEQKDHGAAKKEKLRHRHLYSTLAHDTISASLRGKPRRPQRQ